MTRLTRPVLNAIVTALDAALAGDGFNGGDFDGLDPDHFQRARIWATEQLERREAIRAAVTRAAISVNQGSRSDG